MPDFDVALQLQQGGKRVQRVTAADAGQVAAVLGVAPRQLLSVRAVATRPAARAGEQGHGLGQGQGWGGSPLSLRFFSQELAVLLDAGIPLLEALRTLQQKELRPAAARCLLRLCDKLQEGLPLSAALGLQPRVFGALFVSIVRANERSGSMPQALRAHAKYLAWAEHLRARLLGSLIYPALLLVLGSAVVLFLLLFVMPRFSGVFDRGASSLPWASRLLYEGGAAAAQYPLLAVVLWALPISLVLICWQHPAARAAGVSLAWRVPGLGPRMRVLALAAMYRGLGLLLDAGVPSLAALQLIQGSSAAPLQAALARAARRVAEGQRLSDSLAAEDLATPVAQRMLRVGESSGEVAHMLERAAAFHDEELERLTDWVTHALNPLLMALMGLLVGAIVVLMYLPIFDLIDQVQ